MITVHHSSSLGNLYQVGDLLIDPGVPIKEIRKCVDLTKISSCLCSHGHLDHSRGLPGLVKCAIDCWMTSETAKAMNLNGHRAHVMKSKRSFKAGDWSVAPFPTIHDCAESFGFLLVRGDERILYAVDTRYIPYQFRNLNVIAIEANYSIELLRQRVEAGHIELALARKIIQNHMSIGTALKFLKRQDMSRVREIHLLHLSRGNSDAEDFKRRVERSVGRPVYIGKE